MASFPFNQGGGFPTPGSEMDWVFSRPYFDVVIFGNCHHTGNAREWRRHYNKPYVPQEDTDDTGHKWSYRVLEMRTHLRKYLWKMMMVKCQQLDFYVKGGRPGFAVEEKPGFPHNYDPRGWNEFEKDAVLFRRFFDPKTGPAGTRTVKIRDGKTNFRTPIFIDDYVVHIVRP